jgi:hypothetical protein
MKTICFCLACVAMSAPAFAGNPVNDLLLSMPEAKRLIALGVAAHCTVTQAVYRGTGTSGTSLGKSFWGVRCSNGRAFSIELDPDGQSYSADCTALLKIAHEDCFKKFP